MWRISRAYAVPRIWDCPDRENTPRIWDCPDRGNMVIVWIVFSNHFFYIYLSYKVTRSIRRSPGLTTKCLVLKTPPEEPASQQEPFVTKDTRLDPVTLLLTVKPILLLSYIIFTLHYLFDDSSRIFHIRWLPSTMSLGCWIHLISYKIIRVTEKIGKYCSLSYSGDIMYWLDLELMGYDGKAKGKW